MRTRGRLGAVTITDGTTVEYWDGGDPAGSAVLLQPGTPASRIFGTHLHDDAAAAGVRLVAVSRPGYGGSTTTPPGLASVALAGLALADELGIDDVAVLGVSGGGPYAVATAAVAPHRVRALGVAAGIGCWPEIESPSEADAAERSHVAAAVAGDLAGATAGFRHDLEASFDPLLALDDAAMVEALFSQVPAGKSRREHDPEFRETWAADLREALGSYDGFVRDNLSWGCPWDVDLSLVRAPTFLWYGELDRMVPPPHGEWLARRIPGAVLTVLPGAGHGVTSFDHAPAILRTLT